MIRGKQYKLKPTKSQEKLLLQSFWNCRWVYNRALNRKTTEYKKSWKNLSAFDLMRELTVLKRMNEWLCMTYIWALQHTIVNMETAYKKFFKWAWFPRRKKKNSKQSFHLPQWIKIDYSWNWLYIPKIWRCKFFKDKKPIDWVIKNMTITRQNSGYYASIVYETTSDVNRNNQKECGIDLWIKDFVITSDWEKIQPPKPFIKSQKKLRILQRHLSRQTKKSNRRIKTKQQIARLHEKIANTRLDFLHKTSTLIAKKYGTCYVENLNVKWMLKNRCLSKTISDMGWWIFGTLLQYKTNVIEIGRFEPSSKLCSGCGNIYGELKLSEREWTCKKCWMKHDRDINASINILQIGRASLTNAKTEQ